MSLIDELKAKLGKSTGLSGRQQVVLQRDDIAEALKAGFNKREIWAHLTEKGRVTIQYSPFLRQLKALGLVENTGNSKKLVPEETKLEMSKISPDSSEPVKKSSRFKLKIKPASLYAPEEPAPNNGNIHNSIPPDDLI